MIKAFFYFASSLTILNKNKKDNENPTVKTCNTGKTTHPHKAVPIGVVVLQPVTISRDD